MTVISIDPKALRTGVKNALAKTKRVTAEEFMKNQNRTGCICCVCYKSLKSFTKQLNDDLPLCKPCSKLLA